MASVLLSCCLPGDEAVAHDLLRDTLLDVDMLQRLDMLNTSRRTDDECASAVAVNIRRALLPRFEAMLSRRALDHSERMAARNPPQVQSLRCLRFDQERVSMLPLPRHWQFAPLHGLLVAVEDAGSELDTSALVRSSL